MTTQDGLSSVIEERKEAGLYSWDMATNTLYGDQAVAQLFGLDPFETTSGLPLQKYVERIHAHDRATVIEAIRQSVATGRPFQENYRTCHDDGSVIYVMSFGRSFNDVEGVPRSYAGIVFPMPVEQEQPNKLLWHCLVAYDLAKNEGRTDVMDQLCKILLTLNWKETDEDRCI